MQIGAGTDEAIGASQGLEGFVLQVGVMLLDGTHIARVEVIVPGNQHILQAPFGGPGGMKNQVIQTPAGHAVLGIHGVMGELVDERVGLVRDSFAVAIHVVARKTGGFDGVFAQVPDLIQDGIAGVERSRIFIKRIKNDLALHRFQAEFARKIFNGHIAKRVYLADVAGHLDRIATITLGVGRPGNAVIESAFLHRQGDFQVADVAPGIFVYHLWGLQQFPHFDPDRVGFFTAQF